MPWPSFPFVVMPAPKPIPEREIQIGKRLRDARGQLLISQTLFAAQLEISQARLAKYELGLTPLPWAVGATACSVFHISKLWLGTGEGDAFFNSKDAFFDGAAVERYLGHRPTFSAVTDEILIPLSKNSKLPAKLEKALSTTPDHSMPNESKNYERPKRVPAGPFFNLTEANLLSAFITEALRPTVGRIPPSDLPDFLDELKVSLIKLESAYKREGK